MHGEGLEEGVSDTHTNHAHEPAEAVAAFWFTCKHCGRPIVSEHCPECDGMAGHFSTHHGWMDCPSCNGSGIKRWVEVK